MTTNTIPEYRKRLGYHGGLLGGIGLITSMAVLIGSLETHSAIEAARAEEQRISLEQVIPAALHDNDLLNDAVTIQDADGKAKQVFVARQNGQLTAAAYQMSIYGYGGDIVLIMAVDKDGKILGVRTLSHKETPGLADKIELNKNKWVLSFDGKSLGNPSAELWAVKKDKGIFDQFTGATITPRAYVKAVKQGLQFFADNKLALEQAQSRPAVPVPAVQQPVVPTTPAPEQPESPRSRVVHPKAS